MKKTKNKLQKRIESTEKAYVNSLFKFIITEMKDANWFDPSFVLNVHAQWKNAKWVSPQQLASLKCVAFMFKEKGRV